MGVNFYDFVANFKPRIDPISKNRKNRRQKSDGSLKRKIPTNTDPAAPIPVHTAYAVPIGKVCTALLRSKKLKLMQIKKPILQFSLVKFWDSFKHVVNPTSNNPPRMRKNQAILSCKLWGVGCGHQLQLKKVVSCTLGCNKLCITYNL